MCCNLTANINPHSILQTYLFTGESHELGQIYTILLLILFMQFFS